jgi:hypothetical protein
MDPGTMGEVKPSHPTGKAILLMAGVVIVLVLISVMSVMGGR